MIHLRRDSVWEEQHEHKAAAPLGSAGWRRCCASSCLLSLPCSGLQALYLHSPSLRPISADPFNTALVCGGLESCVVLWDRDGSSLGGLCSPSCQGGIAVPARGLCQQCPHPKQGAQGLSCSTFVQQLRVTGPGGLGH